MNKRSRYFCMAPWAGLSFHPDGTTFPCTRVSDSRCSTGNLNEMRVPEIWNSERMRRIRLNMLGGRPSPECADCDREESFGQRSVREWMNDWLAGHEDNVARTGPDGSLPEVRVAYLNVSFSNLCNFACVYCCSWKSSRWHEDHAKLWGAPPAHPKLLIPRGSYEALWQEIEPLLPNLEQVYFTGGEPLLSPLHGRFLKALLKLGRRRVFLQYNTNLSSLGGDASEVPDLWNEFERVMVTASLDAHGPRGEYLRFGQNWEKTEANWLQIQRRCSRVQLRVGPVLSALNALHLPDFHREWLERGFLQPDRFSINILSQPEEYGVQVLPAAYKRRVAERYGEHVAWLGREYGDPMREEMRFFDVAAKFMTSSDRPDLLAKLRWQIRKLDSIRGTRLPAVFPELAEIAGEGS